MKKANYIIGLLTGIGIAFLSGCSAQTLTDTLPQEGTVPVRLEIDAGGSYTRAPGDAALSVNRILILPFRKTDEGLTNDPANFVLDCNLARQINANLFPTATTTLNLSAASTYQLLIIGYNQNDYDFADQGSATRRFNISSTATPATLASLSVQPVTALAVPEFFSCIATGYLGTTTVGQAFVPSQIDHVKGTLTRLVSGLTLRVTNVPGYVNSMTLSAERLVTASVAADATPSTWQTAGDGGLKTLGTATPVAGSVTFNLYMMPITTARNSLLYLDVAYGTGFVERYTVKVADSPGVVLGNRIAFGPNHWVQVTGDYANINLGFALTNNVNLDDDAWDGIQ